MRRLGWWLDRELLEKGLVTQIGSVIGAQGGGMIEAALSSAREPREGVAATIAGSAVLLFGATGVFGELQEAFERVWSQGRGRQGRPPWWHAAALRLRGIGYILVFGAGFARAAEEARAARDRPNTSAGQAARRMERSFR